MKKYYILAVIVLIALSSRGQYVPNSSAQSWKGVYGRESLQFPTGCGAPVTSINAPFAGASALYYDSCADKLYKFNNASGTWSEIGGGVLAKLSQGYAINIDNTLYDPKGADVSIRVDTAVLRGFIGQVSPAETDPLSVHIADSAAMLNPYLRKADTSNKWMNNLRRLPGSLVVEKKIGSAWSAAFIDSVINGSDSGFIPYSKPVGGGFTYRNVFRMDTTTTFPTLKVPELLIDSAWKFTKMADPQGSTQQATMLQRAGGVGRSNRLYFGNPYGAAGSVSFEGLTTLQLITFSMRVNPSIMNMNDGSQFGSLFGGSPSYKNGIINVSGNTTQSDLVFVVDGTSRNPFGAAFDTAAGEMMRIKGVTRRIGINLANPQYTLDVNGSFRAAGSVISSGNIYNLQSKPSAYTLTGTDQIITGDATGGAFNVTLPTAQGRNGQVYTVKKVDASANAVTVNTTASQTIDGRATYALGMEHKFVTVVSDGANWKIISTNVANSKRVTTITSAATITPDANTTDALIVSALAVAVTFNAPTGTPAPFQELIIRIRDNGTAQNLNWNAIYRGSNDLPLPRSTSAGRIVYIKFYYNTDAPGWDLMGVLNGF